MKKKSTDIRHARKRRSVVTTQTDPQFALNPSDAALADTLYQIRKEYGSIDKFMKATGAEVASVVDDEKALKLFIARAGYGRKHTHAHA